VERLEYAKKCLGHNDSPPDSGEYSGMPARAVPAPAKTDTITERMLVLVVGVDEAMFKGNLGLREQSTRGLRARNVNESKR
jgi:hypothetical protein